MRIMYLADYMHQLIVSIWGKKHAGRGYNWIHAKFGSMNQEEWDENRYYQIISCLKSKRDQEECPIHKRIHGTKRTVIVKSHVIIPTIHRVIP